MDLTPEQIAGICRNAAHNAVEEFGKSYPCKLSEEERGHVHALSEALKEEGGNHGTLRVLVQWGVNMTDVTKQVRRVILWLVAIIALSVFIDWKFIK